MARPRKLNFADPGLPVVEILARRDYDPLDNLVAQAKEVLPLPTDKALRDEMLAGDYERFQDVDGVIKIRLKAKFRIDINKSLLPFRYPSLRSTETREQKDYKFEIVINGGSGSEKTITIDAAPVEQKQIDGPKD